jgi:hypothetical protein
MVKTKKSWLRTAGVVLALCLAPIAAKAEELLKPFVLASISGEGFDTVVKQTKESLSQGGFTIVGEYAPYADAQVIVVTNSALQQAAASSKRGGYAAVQRVSVTAHNGEVQVAYVNPIYIQHAYQLDADLMPIARQLERVLGKQQPFGAEGLTPKQLRRYHYAFGMEYFDDPYELARYASRDKAVAAVEKGLANNKVGVSKIYRLDIPGTSMTLFGVSMKAPPNGDEDMDDAHQMGIVDFADLKGTAYLPYEILVNGRDVEALHMRFRMAVHYPDLRMMGEHSFMKLRSSPSAIEEALTIAAGGEVDTGF